MKNIKLFIIKHNNVFVVLLLLIVVFSVYYKCLGLTLYGDDWLVISKHLGYGTETGLSYWAPGMWVSTYAFQKMTPYLYFVFGFNFLPYFVTSLILRTFV